tara:strand:- start:93 stop:506 length:414 start_codon:yes stop_codon:yes gene_type:complete
MRQLFLIGGTSGSGKTSLAWGIYDFGRNELEPVAADDFMVDEEGNYEFDKERLSEVHEKCRLKVQGAMQQGNSRIFVHNTFTTMEERQAYHDLADLYNYQVIDMVVLNTHGNKSVHKVPEKTLKAQRDRLAETIKTI